MADTILEVKNLKKYFKTARGTLHAVDDVSFTIERGKTLGIVGESGCGKSTTGRAILRLLEPTSGKVVFDGKDITSLSAAEMRKMRSDMQIIFQDPFSSLDPRKTVSQTIAEPIIENKILKDKKAIEARVKELMETVGLAQRLVNTYPHELDGGRRQRIGIARALAMNPKFIVCDEPVSALDVSIQSQVLNLLRQLQESMGMAYIFISHNLSVIKHISDRVMVMYLGHVVELADKKELFANPSHPYTQALLSAIPVPERHSKRKKIILQGDLPSPANPPSGCIFHTRCFMAQEICSTQKPELRDIGGGHLCACHFCNGACAQNETTEEK